MFTVKHIGIGGDEALYECFRATYHPPQGTDVQSTKADARTEKPHVVLDTSEDVHFNTLFNGTVFVMNAEGATVSRWDLGASPVPLRDDVTGKNVRQKIDTSFQQTSAVKRVAA